MKDMETIVYGLLSSCNCRYCLTDYTIAMQKASNTGRKVRSVSVSLKK